METLIWMSVVGLLIVAGFVLGFWTHSVWLGGGLVGLGVALATVILVSPYVFAGEVVSAVPKP